MKFAAITAKMLRYTLVNCTEISVRHGGGNGPARRIENQLRIPLVVYFACFMQYRYDLSNLQHCVAVRQPPWLLALTESPDLHPPLLRTNVVSY